MNAARVAALRCFQSVALKLLRMCRQFNKKIVTLDLSKVKSTYADIS